MKSSVYIETSIVSYLTGRPSRDVILAGRQALTVEWWDSRRDRFDLYVSALVVTEAEDGDPEAVRRRLAAIEGIPAVTISDEARALARQLIHGGPMPEEYPEDALHIAVRLCVEWNGLPPDVELHAPCERLASKASGTPSRSGGLSMSDDLHTGGIDGGMSICSQIT
jgi:hypothetical protein